MILRFIKSLGIYLLLVLGGTILFITLAPLLHYVSYSVRPGPGFYERKQPFSLGELVAGMKFGAGYALFMSPYAAVIGTLCIFIVRGLEKVKLHRFAVSSIGGVIFFFATGYLALGMGWYIAAGGPLILATAIFGTVAGAAFIPNLRKPNQSTEPTPGAVH